MPVIRSDEHYQSGIPFLLTFSGPRHSIGWQFRKTQKGGPCFVVARTGTLGSIKVLDRFPLTERGWARAWRALVKVDSDAARKAFAILAGRAAADRAREELPRLNAATLSRLRGVRFLGGDAAGAGLALGQLYDLRFMEDRLVILPPGLVDVVLELPYGAIETVDVGGPGLVRNYSQAGAIGLTMVFGDLGEVAGLGSTKIQTIVRVQTTASELFFLDTMALPDAVRIQLSVPLRLIREARPPRAAGADQRGGGGPESVAEQLSKMASMLEAGLLTRDEFESLKAKIIAGS